MDDFFTTLLPLNSAEEEEIEDNEAAAAGVCFILGKPVLARLAHNERRREHRRYLVRLDLLPNPRFSTPWTSLHHTRNDRAYITTMGVNVETFEFILDSGFADLWTDWTITSTRNDVNHAGAPRPERRSLDAAGALGLVLHYTTKANNCPQNARRKCC